MRSFIITVFAILADYFHIPKPSISVWCLLSIGMIMAIIQDFKELFGKRS